MSSRDQACRRGPWGRAREDELGHGDKPVGTSLDVGTSPWGRAGHGDGHVGTSPSVGTSALHSGEAGGAPRLPSGARTAPPPHPGTRRARGAATKTHKAEAGSGAPAVEGAPAVSPRRMARPAARASASARGPSRTSGCSPMASLRLRLRRPRVQAGDRHFHKHRGAWEPTPRERCFPCSGYRGGRRFFRYFILLSVRPVSTVSVPICAINCISHVPIKMNKNSPCLQREWEKQPRKQGCNKVSAGFGGSRNFLYLEPLWQPGKILN